MNAKYFDEKVNKYGQQHVTLCTKKMYFLSFFLSYLQFDIGASAL
jgi:hypothetical protein